MECDLYFSGGLAASGFRGGLNVQVRLSSPHIIIIWFLCFNLFSSYIRLTFRRTGVIVTATWPISTCGSTTPTVWSKTSSGCTHSTCTRMHSSAAFYSHMCYRYNLYRVVLMSFIVHFHLFILPFPRTPVLLSSVVAEPIYIGVHMLKFTIRACYCLVRLHNPPRIQR